MNESMLSDSLPKKRSNRLSQDMSETQMTNWSNDYPLEQNASGWSELDEVSDDYSSDDDNKSRSDKRKSLMQQSSKIKEFLCDFFNNYD